MRAIPAVYENGSVTLLEPVETKGRLDAVLVLADTERDPWDEILDDPRPSPAFSRAVDEAIAQHRAGGSGPLAFGER